MMCVKNGEYDPFYLYFQVIEAGANALVAGSAVFGAKDYAEGIYYTSLFTLHWFNDYHFSYLHFEFHPMQL